MVAVALSVLLGVLLAALVLGAGVAVIVLDRRNQDRQSDTDAYINSIDEKLTELVDALAAPDIAEAMAVMNEQELRALADRVHDIQNRGHRRAS